MIIETIILKSKVTKLELVAHYSGDFNYGLSIGESCYATVIEYNGNEYVVCINKSYEDIYKAAEYFTEMIKYPLAVNRVTRRKDCYEIVRDSVCIGAYNRSMQKSKVCNTCKDDHKFDDFIIKDSDLFSNGDYEIDFDLTDRNWDKDK